MSERKWTPDQRNAIQAEGGTLLLSAAAGSGKTAVLVERIIRLLTKGTEPVRPEELLVVTFTNAAAAEMRIRIADAVDALIKANPQNTLYRKIKMTLPDAEISTIDAFCIKLVRENFHSADIDPDFGILDNSEQRILMSRAMEQTLDELCSNAPDIYDMLNSMTSYGRDDSSLSDKITKLYRFSLAHPFPDIWLKSIEDMYKAEGDIKNSVWGKMILDETMTVLDFCIDLMKNAAADAAESDVISEKYNTPLSMAADYIASLQQQIQVSSWDEIVTLMRTYCLPKLPAAPKGYGKDPIKLAAEGKYKRAKELLERAAACFCADSSEHTDDIEAQQPVIKELAAAVRNFGRNYDALKKEKGSYTFNDIMHKALALLAETEDGRVTRTPLACELQQRYREILIDEYQDTNEAQDMLFTMLSRNNTNMFTVGDVKQSIYRFRLAMPEIFVKKSRAYTLYDGETYPAKIILGKNFRSRKGVLDNINFLFKNLMSDYVGEMDYTDADALYFGGGYPEDETPAMQLRFVTGEGVEAEAAYVARLIKKMLDDGAQVTNRDGTTRPAVPGDFCILLRSLKNKAEHYEKALRDMNINASSEKKAGLFDATEVMVFMSLLKIINNPTDDIAMLSVMLSPLYGFTADELSVMKQNDKKCRLYTCVKNACDNNAKAKKLFDDLKNYRRMSAVMPPDILLRTLLELTGYMAVVSSLKNGGSRKMNLIMLCSLASAYEANGGSGLGGFIRFVDRAAENGADIPAAGDVSADAQVVRIYSIHKSKGLEFPFVILADCAKPFNTMDSREEMLISPSAGVGMVMINNENLQKYGTLAHTAAKIAIKRASASEELRILYVAMTRAKEKLIAVSTVKDLEKAVMKTAVDTARGKKPSPGAVLNASSYMQWLLLGFMSHPDMHEFAAVGGLMGHRYQDADSRLTVITEDFNEENITSETKTTKEPKDEIIQLLREKTAYEYPFVIPHEIKPKRVASDFEDKKFAAAYFASSKPSFLSKGKLSAAEKGTANHLFLQNLDFFAENAATELERMKKDEILTPEQCAVVRLQQADSFLRSPLCERIRRSEQIYREKEFTVNIPIGAIYSPVADNIKDEKILILGKADLIFTENGKAVIVDYKTDRSKTLEQFKQAYSGQLKMYKLAVEQLLDIPVTETVIYSLTLGEEIQV